MGGPRDYHTKWIKSDRERQISYCLLWNLKKKNDPNELTLQNRPANTEDKLMVTKGVVRGKLGGWYYHMGTSLVAW